MDDYKLLRIFIRWIVRPLLAAAVVVLVGGILAGLVSPTLREAVGASACGLAAFVIGFVVVGCWYVWDVTTPKIWSE